VIESVFCRVGGRAAIAGVLVLGALALGGCGSSQKVIDSSTAAPVIHKQIAVSGAPAAKSIDCPQTVPADGKTFTCHVALQDGAAYDMTIRVDHVGSQRSLLTVVRSLLVTVGASNVKPLIEQQIRTAHAPALKSITCQNAPATVGTTFTCKVTVADGHVLADQFRVLTVSGTAPPTFQIKGLGVT
jgi:hypothetical protein